MEGSSSSFSRTVPEQTVPNVLKCGVCRAPPRSPVATSCGHMFCWPCLYPHFLLGQPQPCPVCCTTLLRSETNIVPHYGSNSELVAGSRDSANSNNVIPPRPNPPPVVSAPFPSQNEVLEAFVVLEMVNEQLRQEKLQVLAENRDRYKTLFSVLQDLRTKEVGPYGQEMSPKQRRHDKRSVRREMTTIYGAIERFFAQVKEMWNVRSRFREMQNELSPWVTQVGGAASGWWSDQGMPIPYSEDDDTVVGVYHTLRMMIIGE